MSTSVSCSRRRATPPCAGLPHETTVRAPASAVVDRSVFGVMGIPPDREEEAFAMAQRHLDRFAVGDDVYDYPLAFTVYEATA